MFLQLDDNGFQVQGFAPTPSKSINQSIAIGGTYTTDTTEDLAFQIISDVAISLSIDGGTTQFPIPAGMPFGLVTVKIDSIIVTNSDGANPANIYIWKQ